MHREQPLGCSLWLRGWKSDYPRAVAHRSAFRRTSRQSSNKVKSGGMKFFDCNAMIGQTVVPMPEAILDTRSLLSEMDRLEIDQALFFHYAFTMDQKADMNRLTLAPARESSRLIPTWG